MAREILSLKTNAPVVIRPKARYGAYTAPAETLVPDDICYFGGKAANYGLLRRTTPTNSPEAIAFSMDLWDDFMDQTLSNGIPLRAEIAARLAPFQSHTQIVGLSNVLYQIRDLIRRTAGLTPAQREAITNALAQFTPTRKTRFRSSTNVEDSEAFSGAGLYDSYSGCLADDQDNDAAGPCRCDATETSERGVFRAIQRVYASFYNDNAYLARRFHGVDEETVGMGLLVHYSTPDEIELANGVATVTWRKGDGDGYWFNLVSQKGAVSVANPQRNAQPEIMTGRYECVTPMPVCEPTVYARHPSSLVPVGRYVLEYPQEYHEFGRLFGEVIAAYRQHFPSKAEFTLDLEYKKVSPGFLEIKQVREVPGPKNEGSATPYLLNEPITLCTGQGVEMDTFTAHRLKSRWTLTTRNMRLTPETAAEGVLDEIVWERPHNGRVERFVGRLNEFTNYSVAVENVEVKTCWQAETHDGPAMLELAFGFWQFYPNFLGSTTFPWITTDETIKIFRARYEQPVLCYWTELSTHSEDSIGLELARSPTVADYRFECRFDITNRASNIVIQTVFWTTNPQIYTDYPRLVGNLQTRIEGFTAEPIELRGFFSQTWSSVHYLYSDRFIFEPRLEPGISQSVLDQLAAANIRYLFVTHLDNIPCLQIMGLDNLLRDW